MIIKDVKTSQEMKFENAAQTLNWMAALTRRYGVINIASAAEFKQAVSQVPKEYLDRYQIQIENGISMNVSDWLMTEGAKQALKQRYHSDAKNSCGYRSVRSPSMHRRHLQSVYQINHNDLADMELPLPAVNEFKVRGTNRRKAKASAQSRSWKSQTKARAQWARHMEGPCRCYTEQGESGDALLLRLARDGFPVVLAG